MPIDGTKKLFAAAAFQRFWCQTKSGSGVAWSCEVDPIADLLDTDVERLESGPWEPDMCKKYWLSWCRGACPSSVGEDRLRPRLPSVPALCLKTHLKAFTVRTVLFGLVSVMFPLVRKGVADVC